MLLEIGRFILLGLCQAIGVVIAACLLLFAAGGLVGTLREAWDGKVGILLISAWFAAGLSGIYKAFLAEWNFFSYAVVTLAAIIAVYFYKVTKDEAKADREPAKAT